MRARQAHVTCVVLCVGAATERRLLRCEVTETGQGAEARGQRQGGRGQGRGQGAEARGGVRVCSLAAKAMCDGAGARGREGTENQTAVPVLIRRDAYE